MSTPLATGPLVSQRVPYKPYPCDEGKAMRLVANFVGIDQYELTLNNAVEQNQLDSVQAIYVDNVGNAQRLTFDFSGSNQRIIVPAGAQGYWPVLAPTPATILIATTGSVTITFHLLNFPTPCHHWIP